MKFRLCFDRLQNQFPLKKIEVAKLSNTTTTSSLLVTQFGNNIGYQRFRDH